MTDTFQPIWASPPGDTIEQILSKKNLSHEDLANALELSEEKVHKLVNGKISISKKIAKDLEIALGATSEYWLNRDLQYKADLVRYKEEQAERKEWIKSLPTRDMISLGWISNTYTKEVECLNYFEVSTVDEWYKKYNDILAVTAFRTSHSFDSKPESVVTWLRRGELLSDRIISDSWDESSFLDAIHKARELTREQDPQIFIPILQQIFSKCGVAIVVEKAPKLCRASGAAYFISPSKAVIMLSGRYLSDDHFWFSFFHEAGHILLHGNRKLFLEFDNANNDLDNEEKEANIFSERILIPDEYKEEFLTLNSRRWKNIIRFAKKINTSPGVVLGQLQHKKIVDARYLNKLKKRYKWSGAKLVCA